jgi:hypothetical protein
MPPAPVVRAALRTLGRKPLVIPGPANKVSDFASKTALVTGAGSGIGEVAGSQGNLRGGRHGRLRPRRADGVICTLADSPNVTLTA